LSGSSAMKMTAKTVAIVVMCMTSLAAPVLQR
jgi:hypothetical protein